jgi:tetratricopeptide (TPR) repeat protein
VLDGLLRTLGIEGQLIPAGLSERAELYRSRLADRRMLVLLDNAADEAQVRPLLPGSPGCRVLITSRSRLAGLEGANIIDLDVLTPAQAIDLLGRVAGTGPVAAQPAAAGEIVRLCGCLPLAVRIAGARLAARRNRPLAWLVSRLADERRRLDELAAGDLEVRASFALSYQGLKPDLAQAFRLLGMLRAPDFAPWVLSALLDVPLAEAEDRLESLVDAHLVETDTGTGTRYRMHDLVRVYAHERLDADELAGERQAALERFLAASLWLVECAGQQPSSRVLGTLHGPAPRRPLPARATEPLKRDVSGWFETEHDVLADAVHLACAAGLDAALCRSAWDLAGSMAFLFAQTGHVDKGAHTHHEALVAVRRADDRRGGAILLAGLSQLASYLDRVPEAAALERQAALAFDQIGDRHGRAITDACVAARQVAAGRYEEAESGLSRALGVLREFDDLRTYAYALRVLGTMCLEQQRVEEAQARFEEGLEIARQAGFVFAEAYLLVWLARAQTVQGRTAEALASSHQALAIFRRIKDGSGEAAAPQTCGELYLKEGHSEQARTAFELSLTIRQEVGDRSGQAHSLHTLGQLALSSGDAGNAITHFEAAVDMAWTVGRPVLAAHAPSGLADAYTTAGDPTKADDARLESLKLFHQAGLPSIDCQGQLSSPPPLSANT